MLFFVSKRYSVLHYIPQIAETVYLAIRWVFSIL